MADKERQQGDEAKQIPEEHDHERVHVAAYMLDRRVHGGEGESGERHQGDAAQAPELRFVQKRLKRQRCQPY
jgi:hypothetical protein